MATTVFQIREVLEWIGGGVYHWSLLLHLSDHLSTDSFFSPSIHPTLHPSNHSHIHSLTTPPLIHPFIHPSIHSSSHPLMTHPHAHLPNYPSIHLTYTDTDIFKMNAAVTKMSEKLTWSSAVLMVKEGDATGSSSLGHHEAQIIWPLQEYAINCKSS